jgi:O-antigen/teichoic acid export membrane protein
MLDTTSYKEAFKATSLFGGVQVYNILINLVRFKIVAVLLGKTGLGILGLLQLPLGIISLVTELGLGSSSVRDIAKAKTDGDEYKISRTVKTVKRWVWMTGLLGMFVVIALSPVLNKWTDVDVNYTWAFLLLSITLLFSAVSGGQTAILRGLRRIKDTAKASLIGSTAGLIISVPFYYIYGLKGIVPTLIIASLIGLLTSWYYSKKVQLPQVTISYKESFFQGKEMIKLGIIITMSNLVMQVASYLIVLFINNRSGSDVVGLYNAGWRITNLYVAAIFTAMTIDYFPRLISLQSNQKKMSEAVNDQAEIAILIIAPLMLLFTTFLPLIIRLIYSADFLPVIDFVQWMILGMLLKAASWALSHIIVAKGDNRLFFLSELFSSVLFLLLNIGAYTFWGLTGIGIAFVVHYLFYFIVMFFIAKIKYQISFSKNFNKLFFYQSVLCALCFLFVIMKGFPLAYISGSILFIFSAIYSLKKMNQKMDIKAILKNRKLFLINKFNNNDS